MQLNGFLGKDSIFIFCFLKVQLYLCIHLSIYFFFLSDYVLALNIFSRSFSLNLVDKLLNGSTGLIDTGSLFLES